MIIICPEGHKINSNIRFDFRPLYGFENTDDTDFDMVIYEGIQLNFSCKKCKCDYTFAIPNVYSIRSTIKRKEVKIVATKKNKDKKKKKK